jgi:hypothetical protein
MSTFQLNERVRRNDTGKGIRYGTIIAIRSRDAYMIGDLHLGPYPELYDVKFDDNTIGENFLPHGLDSCASIKKTNYDLAKEGSDQTIITEFMCAPVYQLGDSDEDAIYIGLGPAVISVEGVDKDNLYVSYSYGEGWNAVKQSDSNLFSELLKTQVSKDKVVFSSPVQAGKSVMQELSEQLKSEQDLVHNLSMRNLALEEQHKTDMEQYAAMNEELFQANQQIRGLQNDYSNSAGELISENNNLKIALREEVDRNSKFVLELTGNFDKERRTLKGELEQEKRESAMLGQVYKEQSEKYIHLTKSIKSVTEERTILSKAHQTKCDQFEQANNELVILAARINRMTQEINGLMESNDKLNEENTGLKERYENAVKLAENAPFFKEEQKLTSIKAVSELQSIMDTEELSELKKSLEFYKSWYDDAVKKHQERIFGESEENNDISNHEIYQIVLIGYDSDSDEGTRWIAAPSESAVQRICEALRWNYQGDITKCPDLINSTNLNLKFCTSDLLNMGVDVVVAESGYIINCTDEVRAYQLELVSLRRKEELPELNVYEVLTRGVKWIAAYSEIDVERYCKQQGWSLKRGIVKKDKIELKEPHNIDVRLDIDGNALFPYIPKQEDEIVKVKGVVINHEEAYQLALVKQEESNLSRCYLDMCDKYKTLRSVHNTLRANFNTYLNGPNSPLKTRVNTEKKEIVEVEGTVSTMKKLMS